MDATSPIEAIRLPERDAPASRNTPDLPEGMSFNSLLDEVRGRGEDASRDSAEGKRAETDTPVPGQDGPAPMAPAAHQPVTAKAAETGTQAGPAGALEPPQTDHARPLTIQADALITGSDAGASDSAFNIDELLGLVAGREAAPAAASSTLALLAQPSPAAASATPAETPPPAPPATTNIPVPLGSPAWSSAFSNSMQVMVSEGIKTATLTVTPEDMGPIDVKIQVRDQQVDIAFAVSNPEAKAAIQNALSQLKDTLTEGGLQLGDASISARDPGQRESFRDGRQASGQPSGGGSASSGLISGIPARGSAVGLVDTYA